MRFKLIALVFMVSLGPVSVAHSKPLASQGTVCWPLNLAGVVVGVTNESQSQRLLGEGVFRKDEGTTGGRYFIDATHKVTLHLIYGSDSVVEKLILSSGIDSAIHQTELQTAATKWLSPEASFGNWHALRLGSSRKAALENLGQPKIGYSGDRWVYQTTCTCELPEYFILYFEHGHLTRISLEAPQG